MRILVALILAAGTALPALAQTGPAPVPQSDGRFSISPTADGYLKLDSRTGTVSECRRGADGFACSLVPDERDALQAEIERLRTENEKLRGQVAQGGPILDTSPDAAPGPGTRAPQAGEPAPRRDERPSAPPGDDEFERALSMMERFLRRFMTILREEAPPGERI